MVTMMVKEKKEKKQNAGKKPSGEKRFQGVKTELDCLVMMHFCRKFQVKQKNYIEVFNVFCTGLNYF